MSYAQLRDVIHRHLIRITYDRGFVIEALMASARVWISALLLWISCEYVR